MALPYGASVGADPRAVPPSSIDRHFLADANSVAYCDAAVGGSAPDGAPFAPTAAPPARRVATGERLGADGLRLRLAGGGVRGESILVRFAPAGAGPTSLEVLDATGRRVRKFAPGTPAAAEASAVWDLRDAGGRACPSGVYFIVLRRGALRSVVRAAVLW